MFKKFRIILSTVAYYNYFEKILWFCPIVKNSHPLKIVELKQYE